MDDITTAPPRAKTARQAQKAAASTAAAPVPPRSGAAPESAQPAARVGAAPSPFSEVALAALFLVKRADSDCDASLAPEAISVHGGTLLRMALTLLEQIPQVESANGHEHQTIADVASLLFGALAAGELEAPSRLARHKDLREAFELIDAAATSFGFEAEPCEHLAEGIRAGRSIAVAAPQRAHRGGRMLGDHEDITNEAAAISDLIGWISGARDLCDDLRLAISLDRELEAAVRKHNICFNSPNWESAKQGNSMGYLLMHQRSLLEELAGEAT